MKKERILSVDMLRGLVMVIMALDHVRDYSSMYHFDPEDLTQSNFILFLTRWVTHYCAPVFMFVAGVGTGLGEIGGKTKKQISHFLWTRGLWLVLLEVTVIRFSWFFNFDYSNVFLMVIWALGISMIFLAAIIYLPKKTILIGGLIMVFGHNLVDSIDPESLGAWSPLWKVFHTRSFIPMGSFNIAIIYPLVPWIGVMALGYVFGESIYRQEREVRQRNLLIIGSVLTGLFILIRGINVYGDMNPWSVQPTFTMTIASFLNTTKYPPSLSYLLMTIGPAILTLYVFEKVKGPVAEFLIVIGRVPMFYYVLHIYLIHLFSVALGLYQGFSLSEMMQPFFMYPQDFGYGLPVSYALWIIVVAILYPLCKWYMNLKKRKSHPLFSYI